MKVYFLIKFLYLYYMLKVKVTGKIEGAIKALRSKVIKTRQMRELNERREYTKDSVKRRKEIKKAVYAQNKFKQKD
jgi:small subunit ribosomal protein S21